MKRDIAFHKFVASWIGGQSKTHKKYKMYIVDKTLQRKRIKGNGVFIEFDDGSGMFISAIEQHERNTACLMSWPDGPKKGATFITRACCSNVIKVGVDVYEILKR